MVIGEIMVNFCYASQIGAVSDMQGAETS